MRIEFHRTGAERKALVTAIGEILEVRPQYKGMPSAAYEIGYFTVTKEGTLEFDDWTDSGRWKTCWSSLLTGGSLQHPQKWHRHGLTQGQRNYPRQVKTSHRRRTWGLRWKSRLIRYRWAILLSCWKPRAN